MTKQDSVQKEQDGYGIRHQCPIHHNFAKDDDFNLRLIAGCSRRERSTDYGSNQQGSSVMGALCWNISTPESLVVIRGVGVFDLSFATSFRQTMRAQGAAGFCKLFDLSRADIKLSNEDLQTMAASTRLGGPIKSGPIAIYLGRTPPPLLVDMAVLMKERIGHRRRVRLFTDEILARQWLAEEGPAVNLPHGIFHLPPRDTTSASLRR